VSLIAKAGADAARVASMVMGDRSIADGVRRWGAGPVGH